MILKVISTKVYFFIDFTHNVNKFLALSPSVFGFLYQPIFTQKYLRNSKNKNVSRNFSEKFEYTFYNFEG